MRSLIVSLVIAGAFLMGVSVGITWQMQDEALARAAMSKLPPPAMTPRGASILSCPVTKASIQEYYRICRGRARMEEVKPT